MKTRGIATVCRVTEKAFGICFAFSFCLIILNIIFNKQIYSYNTLILLLLICIFSAVMIFFGCFFNKQRELLSKYFSQITLLAGSVLFLIQMLMLSPLRFEPIFDLEAIYRGAIELTEGRLFSEYKSKTCHTDYFYIFPNNLGSMVLLAAVFKFFSLFKITDYFTVAAVFNSVMCVSTMVLTSHISKKLFGVGAGLVTLLIFLMSPPFYFIAPVFYTDSLSLLFPVLAFFLFIKAEESKSSTSKALLFVGCALACAVGALVKMTVLIFAIAAAIYLILRKKWKDITVFSVITVSITLLLFTLFNTWIYSSHLDKAKAEKTNTPIYYWIDLAFHGNGAYNNGIYQMSRNESDPEIRKGILKNDIKSAIDELGADGIYKLFEKKSATAFGDGTYALSDFLDDRPTESGPLHELLTYNGKNYGVYSIISTAVFLSVQILMVLSAVLKKKDCRILITQLSVFGIMLFLLFWEINSRYITTFIPFIFINSAGGLTAILDRFGIKN